MIHITDKVSIDSLEYTVIISYTNESLIAPITVYINQENNSEVGDYVYTIKSYSTFINSTDSTSSATATLNQLLNKKWARPVYLNVNGLINDTSVVPFFRAVTELSGLPSRAA